jgi:hypothetical protein
MVVPAFCPGVHIEILVNGQPLPEYDDIDAVPSAPNTVTKYIEAQSDTEFAIRLKVTEDFLYPAGDVCMEITIDGEPSNGAVIRAATIFEPTGRTVHGRSVLIGGITDAIQKFRFNELQTGTIGFTLKHPCSLLSIDFS